MNAEAQRVLGQLHETAPIYAVLDGARQRRIRGWVADTRAPAWCLWRGRLPDPLVDTAPWLLRLGRGHEYTERFFRVGWRNAWGILLASEAPSRELRRHLRRFFRVRTEARRILLFRYYDPRVLRVYLPTLSAEDSAQFFGPILAFAAEAEEPGAFHLFRRGAAGVEHQRVQVDADDQLVQADAALRKVN